MSHTKDATTDKMIATMMARDVKADAKLFTLSLLDEGFRGLDIGLRLDAVLTGVKVERNMVLARAL